MEPDSLLLQAWLTAVPVDQGVGTLLTALGGLPLLQAAGAAVAGCAQPLALAAGSAVAQLHAQLRAPLRTAALLRINLSALPAGQASYRAALRRRWRCWRSWASRPRAPAWRLRCACWWCCCATARRRGRATRTGARRAGLGSRATRMHAQLAAARRPLTCAVAAVAVCCCRCRCRLLLLHCLAVADQSYTQLSEQLPTELQVRARGGARVAAVLCCKVLCRACWCSPACCC